MSRKRKMNTNWKPEVKVISDGWPGKPETRQARLELSLLVDGHASGVVIQVHKCDPTRGTLLSIGPVGMGYVPATAYGGERRGDIGELVTFAEQAVADGKIWKVTRAMNQDEKDDAAIVEE